MTLIADSVDWPVHYKELKDIDSLLRCPICYEYINIAMAAPKCSHTYCSLCIRRYICYKTQCPTCTKPVSEPELIRNRVVDEIIVAFTAVRAKLLSLVNSAVVVEEPNGESHQKNDSISTEKPNKPRMGSKSETKPSVVQCVDKRTPTREKCKKSQAKRSVKSRRDDSSGDTESSANKRSRRQKKHVKYRQEEGSDTDDSDLIICADSKNDEDYVPSSRKLSESDDESDFRTPHRLNTSSKKSQPSDSKDKRSVHVSSDTPPPSKTPDMPRVLMDVSTPTSPMVRSTSSSQISGKVLRMMKLVSPQSAKPQSRSASPSPARLASLSSISSPPSFISSQQPHVSSQVPSTQASSSQVPTSSNMQRVDCPVCGVSLLQRNINLHLDSCLSGGPKVDRLRSTGPSRKPMPKLVYNLIKDTELRKKLKEVGLPTDGDRQAMIKRHQEFTLIYNTECDAPNPKSAAQIIREMNLNNKMKTKSLSMPNMTKARFSVQKGASEEQVTVAQKTYVKEHKNQFAQLIAETRRRMKEAKAASMKAKDDKDDNKENKLAGVGDTDRAVAGRTETAPGDSVTVVDSDNMPGNAPVITMNSIDAAAHSEPSSIPLDTSDNEDLPNLDVECDIIENDCPPVSRIRTMSDLPLPSLPAGSLPGQHSDKLDDNTLHSGHTQCESNSRVKPHTDGVSPVTACSSDQSVTQESGSLLQTESHWNKYNEHDDEKDTFHDDKKTISMPFNPVHSNKKVNLTPEMANNDQSHVSESPHLSSTVCDITSTAVSQSGSSQGILPHNASCVTGQTSHSRTAPANVDVKLNSGSSDWRSARNHAVDLACDADSRGSAADTDLFPHMDDVLGGLVTSSQRRTEDDCLSVVSVRSGSTSIRLSQSPRSTPHQNRSSSNSPVMDLLTADTQQILSDEECPADMPALSPVFGVSQPIAKTHVSTTDVDLHMDLESRDPSSRTRRKRTRSIEGTQSQPERVSKRSRKVKEETHPVDFAEEKTRRTRRTRKM